MMAKFASSRLTAQSIFDRLNRKLLLWIVAALAIFGTGYALYQPVHPDPWHVHSNWDRFYYPQETNPFLHQPSINQIIHHSIYHQGNIWAVGDGGLILQSSDNGRCWQPRGSWVKAQGLTACKNGKQGFARLFASLLPAVRAAEDVNSVEQKQPPETTNSNNSYETNSSNDPNPTAGPTIPEFRSVAFFDKTTAIAVGEEGVIARTDDAGQSWQLLPKLSSASLFDINIANQNEGIIVGGNSTFLLTRDAGKSWRQLSLKLANFRLQAISVGDEASIAVGDNGTIIQSERSLSAWRPVDSGTREDLHSVTRLDNQMHVAVGENGVILRSQDNGRNWQSINVQLKENLRQVIALDTRRLIASGENGIILTSDDQGKSWTQVDSNTHDNLSTVSTDGEGRITVIGINGTVLQSYNWGETWSQAASSFRHAFASVVTANGRRLLAAGYNGGILASDDRGKSWYALDSSSQRAITGLASIGNRILAVGEQGIILQSDDNGDSWRQIDAESPFLWAVSANRLGQAVTVGEKASILVSESSSSEWRRIAIKSRRWLTDVMFFGDQQVIAIGERGSLLRSVDSGNNWQVIDTKSRSFFSAITANRNNLFIATGDGSILRSADSGLSWQPSNSPGQAWLNDIVLDHGYAIAVGENGTILRSSDDGENWSAIDTSTKTSLISVDIHSPRVVIAVGEAGTILRSNDSGLSWQAIDQYSVGMPNWWYLLIVTSIGLVIFLAWSRRTVEPETEGIAGLAASDRPLQPGDPDALNLSSIAADVTEFLSNPKTTAPLTMAITGPWGSGKSSLMNLIRAGLEARGFSPVWFNAWHHQKGEQLLASLFAHIRQQAIPGWLSFDGLLFRLRLTYIRGRRHWFIFSILMCLLFMSLAFNQQALTQSGGQLFWVLAHPDQWWSFPWHSILPDFSLFQQGDWLQTMASVFGIGTPVFALLRTLQGFAINPKRLVSVNQGRDSRQGYDPGARARFAAEFRDVTQALGSNKMVIFIDDLDRCSQDNLIDILENINFMASSGDCFMILGMAPEYIEACVANAYEKLAHSIAAKDAYDAKGFDNEKAHKFNFAHSYLEKMINIEVPVPQMQTDNFDRMLNLREIENSKKDIQAWFELIFDRLFLITRKTLPLAIILIMIGVGWEYGREIPPPPVKVANPIFDLSAENAKLLLSFSDNAAKESMVSQLTPQLLDDETGDPVSFALQLDPAQLQAGIPVGSIGSGKDQAVILIRRVSPPIPKELPIQYQAESEAYNPVRSRGENRLAEFRQAAFEVDQRLPTLPWLIAAALLLAFMVYSYGKARGKYSRDSADFIAALSRWTPMIQLRQETPRAVKRFLNHLRFLAIRNKAVINESLLVAYSSIYFFRPDWLLEDADFERFCAKDIENLLKDLSKTIGWQGQLETGLQKIADDLSAIIEQVDLEDLMAHRERAIQIIRGG